MLGLANAATTVCSREPDRTHTVRLSRALRAVAKFIGLSSGARSFSPASSLSDHQLNDIGLTTADFRWTVRQPLHIDASGGIARFADERSLGRGQRRP